MEGFADPASGIPVHSLYGARRSPERGELEGLDCIVIDLPDVGARPDTYLFWTSLLMMRACAAASIEVLVLDCPNPIGGEAVEGASRRTIPVVCRALPAPDAARPHDRRSARDDEFRREKRLSLRIVQMKGWKRGMHFDETAQPWVLPLPTCRRSTPPSCTPASFSSRARTSPKDGERRSRSRSSARRWIEPARFRRGARDLRALRGLFQAPPFHAGVGQIRESERCGGIQLHVTDRASPARPLRRGDHRGRGASPSRPLPMERAAVRIRIHDPADRHHLGKRGRARNDRRGEGPFPSAFRRLACRRGTSFRADQRDSFLLSIMKNARTAISGMILAAGFGRSRMFPLTANLPKPLLPILGTPLLELIVKKLVRHGAAEVDCNTFHLPGNDRGVRLAARLARSASPRRGAPRHGRGHRRHARRRSGADCILLHNGDIFSTYPYEPAIERHRERKALVTLVLVPRARGRMSRSAPRTK